MYDEQLSAAVWLRQAVHTHWTKKHKMYQNTDRQTARCRQTMVAAAAATAAGKRVKNN